MTGLLVVLALAMSIAGIFYLAMTDAKRRRVFGLAAVEVRRWVWPARCAVFGPGMLLAALGNMAGFVIWLGALTVLGWTVAALPPTRLREMQKSMNADLITSRDRRKSAIASLRSRVAVSMAGTGMTFGREDPARLAALEARVASLEERLADRPD